MLLRNKKRGQVSETVTWLVATIAILVILSIAIFTASALGKTNRAVTLTADHSPILLKKSLQAYLLTKDASDENVFSKIEESEDVEGFSRELEEKIFKDSSEFRFDLELNSWPYGRFYENLKIKGDLNLVLEYVQNVEY